MFRVWILAAGLLGLTTAPAAAQDIVVTQALQRICVTAAAGPSYEQSTWDAVEVNARALNLKLVDTSPGGDGREYYYSLQQPAGVYEVGIRVSLGGVLCYIDPPDSVTKPQLEQAITQSVGPDWAVRFTPDGPLWTKTSSRYKLSLSVEPSTCFFCAVAPAPGSVYVKFYGQIPSPY